MNSAANFGAGPNDQASRGPGDGPPASVPSTVLRVNGLQIKVQSGARELMPVRGVSFELREGEAVGLIGESGTGKSLTSMALVGMLPAGAELAGGSVRLGDVNITDISEKELTQIRGRDIAMIVQDALTALNPMFRVGKQISESVRLHSDLRGAEAVERAHELLGEVGIADPASVYRKYPHQLSGGMRQRVLGAIALAGTPQVLLADEATTGLDATVQAAYLAWMRDIQRKRGLAVLFVTHDIGVVSGLCERVLVMYAGKIVEKAPTDQLIHRPVHPYAKGLLGSVPRLRPSGERLPSIAGAPAALGDFVEGCRFRTRCPLFEELGGPERCATDEPELRAVGPDREAACHFADGESSTKPDRSGAADETKSRTPSLEARSIPDRGAAG